MGISSLVGAGILDAETLFSNASALAEAVPRSPEMLPPGTYVLGEPTADAPLVGMICTSWHHGADAPPARCPHCGPGQA